MNKSRAHTIITQKSYSKATDYGMLVKGRLTMLVVVTSLLAFLVAWQGDMNYTVLVLLGAGGFLVTAAANALNQVLEKDYDIFMTRTAERPVAAGRMKPTEAVLFAGLASMIGLILLAMINPITCFLGALSFVMYTFVYTPIKRYSTLAVPVGAIPGALPVLIGCTAAEGSITALGIGLFMIQFLWQFPHFWSIGYLSFDDYQKAGYKLVPSRDGEIDRSLGINATFYAVLLIPVLVGMYYMGVIDFVPFVVSIILSLVYVLTSVLFHLRFDRKSAMTLMFTSFFYLPLVLLIIYFT